MLKLQKFDCQPTDQKESYEKINFILLSEYMFYDIQTYLLF